MVHTYYKNNNIKNINDANYYLLGANNHYQKHILLDSYLNLSIIIKTLLYILKVYIVYPYQKQKNYFT